MVSPLRGGVCPEAHRFHHPYVCWFSGFVNTVYYQTCSDVFLTVKTHLSVPMSLSKMGKWKRKRNTYFRKYERTHSCVEAKFNMKYNLANFIHLRFLPASLVPVPESRVAVIHPCTALSACLSWNPLTSPCQVPSFFRELHSTAKSVLI